LTRTALALIAACLAGTALTQDYPARPIRFVVPYPFGGGTEVSGRIVGVPR